MVRVTITGADDAVNPRDLRELSLEFPFVEWGILFSRNRVGTQRYPTLEWIGYFAALGLRCAAHLCGSLARDTMGGEIDPLVSCFGRIQLNGYEPGEHMQGLLRLSEKTNAELILQARSVGVIQWAANEAAGLPLASVLFDSSGGRGSTPFQWPRAPHGARVGYAGGINPENVEEVVAEIFHANDFVGPAFWIDMESGVRTAGNQFDLKRVRAVLESVSKINARIDATDRSEEPK